MSDYRSIKHMRQRTRSSDLRFGIITILVSRRRRAANVRAAMARKCAHIIKDDRSAQLRHINRFEGRYNAVARHRHPTNAFYRALQRAWRAA